MVLNLILRRENASFIINIVAIQQSRFHTKKHNLQVDLLRLDPRQSIHNTHSK